MASTLATLHSCVTEGWSDVSDPLRGPVGRPEFASPPKRVPWMPAHLWPKKFGKNSAENLAGIDAVTAVTSSQLSTHRRRDRSAPYPRSATAARPTGVEQGQKAPGGNGLFTMGGGSGWRGRKRLWRRAARCGRRARPSPSSRIGCLIAARRDAGAPSNGVALAAARRPAEGESAARFKGR
jgi:hypothetical protein